MYKRQQQSKELRDSKPQQMFANSSLQGIYRVLVKDTKQVGVQPNHHISLDHRYYVHQQPLNKLNIHLQYSPQIQQANQLITTDKANIIEEFSKKAKRFFSQQKKKTNSLEGTNLKLKNMILRKRQQKKAQFFQTNTIEPPIANEAQQQRVANHAQTIKYKERRISNLNELNESINKQIVKRYETDTEQRDQQKIETINQHFLKFKQSLRLKPLQFYMKKSKQTKFKILGLSVKKHLKKVFDNKTLKHEQKDTQQLELSIINNEPNQTDWKIQSIPLIISEKKHRFNSTNISKLKKKSSFEALINNCLPHLSISEHILQKMEEIMKFYYIVALSFRCWVPHPELSELPKYNRRQVKYLFYVGSGNNRPLISELMEKRWYWKETSNIHSAHMIWTQQRIKSSSLHKRCLSQEQKASILLYSKPQRQKQEKLKKKLLQVKDHQKYASLFKSFQSNQESQPVDSLTVLNAPTLLQNHLSGGKYLGNKKSLYRLLKLWFEDYQQAPSLLFSFIPQTFHATTTNSAQYTAFEGRYSSGDSKTLWIIKPAQNSNRGRGIFLSNSLPEIAQSVRNRIEQGGTTIIQKYISNLLLYYGRKFDIRTYLLCVTINSHHKFYWFSQGYLRTSSHPYSLKQFSTMTHLTNDAIQNQGDQYGKYQKGNKLSYVQFQSYLDQYYSNLGWKTSSLLKQMKQIAKKIATVSYPLINTQTTTGFQLFGMDFIIDSSFKPWLLQVNTNPCLEQSSPLLQKLIPSLIENVFRVAVDPLFLPSVLPNKQSEYSLPQKMIQWNKFELLFDSRCESISQWERVLQEKWEVEKETSLED